MRQPITETHALEQDAKKVVRTCATFDWDKHLASWLTASMDRGGIFAGVVREMIRVEIQNAKRASRKHKARTK